MSLELLTVIVDINPCWWGQILDQVDEKQVNAVFGRAVDAVTSFCEAYRLMSTTNSLVVIAAGWANSTIIYADDKDIATSVVPGASQSENFLLSLKGRLLSAFESLCNENSQRELRKETRLASSLAQTLCYTNRLRKDNSPAQTVNSRILIVKVSDDTTSQHMSLMNIFFTAQKQHVLIDSCVLLRDSAIMQQACDITGGVYQKITNFEVLLQQMLCCFLSDVGLRTKFSAGITGDVDYRPACCCHQKLIDMGWVCSVCLSVFCGFRPICDTCQTAFRFLPKIVKRKKIK